MFKSSNCTFSEISPDTTINEADPDLTKIPPEYHEFAKVFSKEESDKLPEHHPYDHTIPLQEGTTPPFGPIYNLSPSELVVLREYIDTIFAKDGFVTHNRQLPHPYSSSRNLMEDYVYTSIIAA